MQRFRAATLGSRVLGSRMLGSWALAGLMLWLVAACGGDSVENSPLPGGVSVFVDQSRLQMHGRDVFVRVHNGADESLTIDAYTLTSPRFEAVTWAGEERIGAGYETDLIFAMPTGTCGQKLDAALTLTFRVGDGQRSRTTLPVPDKYGNISELLDRDCAQATLEQAATLSVGSPQVTGTGRQSVLTLPVTLSPTGTRTDVRFGGFGDTVLFRQAPGSTTNVDVALRPGGQARTFAMRVVPSRCDPHALAEDKVGRLFPVTVIASDVAPDASFYLPLTLAQRQAFFAFFHSHCGI